MAFIRAVYNSLYSKTDVSSNMIESLDIFRSLMSLETIAGTSRASPVDVACYARGLTIFGLGYIPCQPQLVRRQQSASFNHGSNFINTAYVVSRTPNPVSTKRSP
jgi:hypothetical protein